MELLLNWKSVWTSTIFRTKLIIGLIIGLGLVGFMPIFFPYIEQRTYGIQFNDRLLTWLTPKDVSIPIFICIWSTTALILYRAFKNPVILITCLYGFCILTTTRMITIYFIPLYPPSGLVPLIDPLSNTFYGKDSFVTRDLFFSGHVSSQFLFFLNLRKKGEKLFCLSTTILVSVLVLLQHVHYTIDVIAAIPMTYFCAKVGAKIATFGWCGEENKVGF